MSVEFSSQTQKLHMAIFEFGWKLKKFLRYTVSVSSVNVFAANRSSTISD